MGEVRQVESSQPNKRGKPFKIVKGRGGQLSAKRSNGTALSAQF